MYHRGLRIELNQVVKMSMRLNKRRGLPLAALVLAALAALAAGCGRNEAPAAAGDALPVVQAVTVQPAPLALSSELPGRIEPDSSLDRRSEEHTSELQSQSNLVCRLLLEKKKNEQHNSARHLAPHRRVVAPSALT